MYSEVRERSPRVVHGIPSSSNILREAVIDLQKRHPRGHQRRGHEDRRTPADDARCVHHQAPEGLRLTTKEKNMTARKADDDWVLWNEKVGAR